MVLGWGAELLTMSECSPVPLRKHFSRIERDGVDDDSNLWIRAAVGIQPQRADSSCDQQTNINAIRLTRWL
jgi:hypothetical protein